MADSAPDLIALDPDDYHAEHVGHTADGRQFFLTTPFRPAMPGDPGSEFVALYLFDLQGNFLEALIDNFGPRNRADATEMEACYIRRLNGLGGVTKTRIEIKPFSVERFGTTFGLIPRPPEEHGDAWAVELLPGNYMCFFEPWDSGIYDT
ncbi:MAG: hypothetical protein M3R13_02140 [Armatimonadota bacterium]|nr:hypothetical protein [Armatimonadota bacterium]